MPAVVDGLQALLDHSLIQSTECLLPDAAPERRFTMLELVHEYAYEHLVAHDEVSTLQRRHAEHYLGLAEEGARETPGGPGHLRWITRLEREQDNVRAALQWALDQREAALAMRFVAALAPFWQRRDDIAEGTRWLNAALSIGGHDPTVDPALHAEALFALTTLVSWGGAVEPAILAAYPPDRDPLDALLDACQVLYGDLGDSAGLAEVLGLRAWKAWRSDYPLAGALHEEQLALARATGNRRGIAGALKGLGRVIYNLGDFARAFTLLEESLALYQELGDRHEIAGAYFDLGVAAYYGGDFPRAEASLERQLVLCRELGDRFGRTGALIHLSGVAGCQGDYERAVRLLDEALELVRERGEPESALSLRFRGQVACQQGAWADAQTAYGASLRLWQEGGVKWEIAACLEGLGRVAAGQGDGARAARVGGAAAELRAQLGAPLPPVDHTWYEAAVAHMRAVLGEGAFAAAWEEGRSMQLEQAVAFALEPAATFP
ncbi:MAG: tetratricopeptide repeat protein [Chloroflexota bacterium]|nr:tetratricopeptide repeat protein [Chloroflexota bacterium]